MAEKLLFPSAAGLLNKHSTPIVEAAPQFALLNQDTFSSFLATDQDKLSCFSAIGKDDNINSNTLIDRQMSSSENWQSDSSLEERKQKNQSKKHKKRKKKKHKKTKKEDAARKTIIKPGTIWIENTNLDVCDAYREDVRPDKNNLEFGGLYKMDIAYFHDPVRVTCLGLSTHQSILLYEKTKRKPKKIKLDVRYFTSRSCDVTVEEDTDHMFCNNVESENFIPLSCMNNEAKEEISQPTSYFGATYLEQSKMFSQKLYENPNDVETWLQFVDYQDELADEETDSYKSRKAVIEKKLSILEKAILKNMASSELHVKYMHLARDVWVSSKLHEKWRDLLIKFPNKNVLWREYLSFVQSNVLSMTVSSVVAVYRKCFRMLLGIYHGIIRTHQAEDDALEQLLAVFIQMIIFLWQAGHCEKAVCMIQCMLEFNICCLESLINEENLQKKKEEFEIFFDSNAPRFGEIGATGWNCWINKSEEIEKQSSIIPHEAETNLNFDLCLHEANVSDNKEKVWIKLEKLRTLTECTPFVGNHDDCEDSDRIILFDDISFVLFTLQNNNLQFQLVVSYLLLLGVPVCKHLVEPKVLECFSKYFLWNNNNNPYDCLCHSQLSCHHVSIKSILFTESNLTNNIVISKIQEILSQSLKHFSSKYVRLLSQVWFHFESMLLQRKFKNKTLNKKYLKEMNRFVKGLLKLVPNRSCIELWVMYATYEWNVGNVKEARRIFLTASQLIQQDDREYILRISKIVRSIMELYWDINNQFTLSTNKSLVLSAYIAYVDPTKMFSSEHVTNPVLLLKISTIIKKQFSNSLNNKDNNINNFLCCFVLFEYLFAGRKALQNCIDELLSNKGQLILDSCSDVFICAVLLLKHDIETKNEGYALYKNILERCSSIYSDNFYLNNLLLSARQHGLDSLHMRRYYDNTILRNPKCVNSWLHAVQYETNRLEFISLTPTGTQVTLEFIDAQTGVHNRIRSLYVRMLKNISLASCGDLWELFITFQMKYGTEKQAKDVYYAALQYCPGNKSLHLLACEQLDNFDEVFNLMMEKELRIKLVMEELDILMEK